MFKKYLTPILALSLVLLSSTAHAFWDPPCVTPASPTAAETVSINIRTGICDAIFNRDGFPRITQVGNAIHIVVYGVHWEPGELCTYPPANGGLAIGEYVPGNYVVTFDMFYIDFSVNPRLCSWVSFPSRSRGARSQRRPHQA